MFSTGGECVFFFFRCKVVALQLNLLIGVVVLVVRGDEHREWFHHHRLLNRRRLWNICAGKNEFQHPKCVTFKREKKTKKKTKKKTQ